MMDKDTSNKEKKSNEGWILLHRRIKNHWLWENPKYLKRWLTILLSVNSQPVDFICGLEKFVCEPGSSYMSIESWAKLFKTNKPQTLRFFKLLQQEVMISVKILGKGNQRKHLLSVINWQQYQKNGTRNGTGNGTRKVPRTKNDIKNDIDARELNFKNEIKTFSDKYEMDMLNKFFNHWSEKNPMGTKMKFELQRTWELSKRLSTWKLNELRYGKASKQTT